MDEFQRLNDKIDASYDDLTRMLVIERDERRRATQEVWRALEAVQSGLAHLNESFERMETIMLNGFATLHSEFRSATAHLAKRIMDLESKAS